MDNKILKQKGRKYAIITFLLFFIPIAVFLMLKEGFTFMTISLSFGLPLPFAIGVYSQIWYYVSLSKELKSFYPSLLATVVSFWLFLLFLIFSGWSEYGIVFYILFGTSIYTVLGYFILKKTQVIFYKNNTNLPSKKVPQDNKSETQWLGYFTIIAIIATVLATIYININFT